MEVTPVQLAKSDVKKGLGVTRQSFLRWCKAARLEAQKGFYESWEVSLLAEVGRYLQEDRNLERAQQHIDRLLGA